MDLVRVLYAYPLQPFLELLQSDPATASELDIESAQYRNLHVKGIRWVSPELQRWLTEPITDQESDELDQVVNSLKPKLLEDALTLHGVSQSLWPKDNFSEAFDQWFATHFEVMPLSALEILSSSDDDDFFGH